MYRAGCIGKPRTVISIVKAFDQLAASRSLENAMIIIGVLCPTICLSLFTRDVCIDCGDNSNKQCDAICDCNLQVVRKKESDQRSETPETLARRRPRRKRNENHKCSLTSHFNKKLTNWLARVKCCVTRLKISADILCH